MAGACNYCAIVMQQLHDDRAIVVSWSYEIPYIVTPFHQVAELHNSCTNAVQLSLFLAELLIKISMVENLRL